MKSDEILIIQYPFIMKRPAIDILREQILDQKKTGVILLPNYCTVVTKPKDVNVQVELEKEDDPTPWELVNNPNYSPFDSESKKHGLFCDGCGITISHYWDNFFNHCPYCGKKHTFDKEET